MNRDRTAFPVIPAVWVYLACAVLLLTIGAKAQDHSFYSGMIITEYGLVLIPVLLVLGFFKLKPRKALRLNPLGFGTASLIALTVLFSMPIILFLNLLVIALISLTGKAYNLPIPSADTMAQLTVLFFIISISAGICEEFFFRGMMLSALERRFGRWPGIFASALLFGLFHFNPQNLLGPIFLGVLFGYLVLLTDSLFAGILAHMVNNGTALLISWAASKMMHGGSGASQGVEMFNQNPKLAFMAVAVYGIMGIGSSGIVFALIQAIRNIEGKRKERLLVSLEVEAGHSWAGENETKVALEAFEDENVQTGTLREKLLLLTPIITVIVIYLAVSGLILNRHTG